MRAVKMLQDQVLQQIHSCCCTSTNPVQENMTGNEQVTIHNWQAEITQNSEALVAWHKNVMKPIPKIKSQCLNAKILYNATPLAPLHIM
jgi:hypothetical protein